MKNCNCLLGFLVGFLLAYTLVFPSMLYAEDGYRLAVSHGFDPRFPMLQVYIDNDPCAAPSGTKLDVVAVVETFDAAKDDGVLLGALNSANQKLLTSLRRECEGVIERPFTAYVTALLDGVPVVKAEVAVKPGKPGWPLPELEVRSKSVISEPRVKVTPLGEALNGFFSRFGPLGRGGRADPGLDLVAATTAAEEMETRQPELGKELGLLVSQLYVFAQSHPKKTSFQTLEKNRAMSADGNAMASNNLLRMHYSSIGDIMSTIRKQKEMDPTLLSKWKKIYPYYVQGLQNGAFAAHDIQQAAISVGATMTEDGISYEVYDGPRREDVERGLSATTTRTSSLGDFASSGSFSAFADRHFTCDGKWCDFGDGMSKWRIISRGRPNCDFQSDETAFCQFPWRFNVQLNEGFFGAASPYQSIMTTMNKANWNSGRAMFTKKGKLWEMSSKPDLSPK